MAAVDLERLAGLALLLRKRQGPIAEPLLELLEEQAAVIEDPWLLLEATPSSPPTSATRTRRTATSLTSSPGAPRPRG
jgi:hypothetical protein